MNARAPEPPARPHRGVTRRAVLLGALLVPLNCYWVIVIEVRWYTLDGSCLPLFITPVFMLAALVVVNLVIGRLSPRRAWSQGELLTVYIMIVMSETMAGHDTLENFFGHITHYAWYMQKHPELPWAHDFGALVPRHLQVFDLKALTGFYEGHSTIYSWSNLRPWLGPLAWWSAFILVIVMMMLAVNVIFRRAWTEHEKLSFPIIQLPLAMTQDGAHTRFFASPLMWLGFTAAAGIELLNGLHQLYPALPYLPIRTSDVQISFPSSPWAAMNPLPFSFYPFAIGLAYFLPLDLSFSCWFFYLFGKLERVGGSWKGYDRFQDFPYLNAQASGAWIGLALFLLWSGRGWLRQVWTTALGRGPLDDRAEPMRYRSALLVLAGGVVFLFAFWGYAGMSPITTALYFLIFFLIAVAITRVRAEFGAPHEIVYVNPEQIMVNTLGARELSARDLTAIVQTHWLNRGYRNHPMPSQLEGFKMGETAAMDGRRLLWVMFGATALGMLATYWAHLHECYRNGAMAGDLGFKWWAGNEAYTRLTRWIEFGEPAQTGNRVASVAGMCFIGFLGLMRARYIWWPFHPAGYALGISYAVDYFWFTFFIAWLVKLLLVRYGGMRAHRGAVPFFLGLILGDYVVGSIWAIIGPVANIETYQIFIR